MSEALKYVFSVGGFAVASLIAILWMLARPRSGSARKPIVVITLIYVFATLRAVPWLLSRPLVVGLQPLATHARAGPGVIVLLAAGPATVHERHQRLGVLDLMTAARVLEAAHVFRLFDSAWIISSGGKPGSGDLVPSAMVMRDALISLGIPASRILLEPTSSDTHEEALLVAPMLVTLNPHETVLVTTDTHMRRALAAFRGAGVQATPAIVEDPLTSESWPRSFVPTAAGLRFTSAVVHEYVGMIDYGLRGWLRF